jgi:hypothetical protein
MTPQEIERSYEQDLKTPFPYRDCGWLRAHTTYESGELTSDLNMYFSDIAGFASTATRLHERKLDQLTTNLPCLKMTFLST